jgi:hypothetical protein
VLAVPVAVDQEWLPLTLGLDLGLQLDGRRGVRADGGHVLG